MIEINDKTLMALRKTIRQLQRRQLSILRKDTAAGMYQQLAAVTFHIFQSRIWNANHFALVADDQRIFGFPCRPLPDGPQGCRHPFLIERLLQQVHRCCLKNLRCVFNMRRYENNGKKGIGTMNPLGGFQAECFLAPLLKHNIQKQRLRQPGNGQHVFQLPRFTEKTYFHSLPGHNEPGQRMRTCFIVIADPYFQMELLFLGHAVPIELPSTKHDFIH